MPTAGDLLEILRRRRVATARELAADLGASQSTVSRLIAAAGNRICRMGRTRGAAYAITRTVPQLDNPLPVYRIDERGTAHRHGVLHLLTEHRHWFEPAQGPGTLFNGCPPYVWDMYPQGYMGRTFPSQYPELGLPPRITDWNDDHRLIALARRGEDCAGDLILGDESMNRFLAGVPQPIQRDQYPQFAQLSLAGQPGSSAGGEHPKFGAYVDGRHVLVKFAGGDAGPATQRWRDLLAAERVALESLRAAGMQAAAAQTFVIGDYTFLEVERFDRVDERGRRAVLSLAAINNEYVGAAGSWTTMARHLQDENLVSTADGRRMRWLDTFGQLIGNTDRHLGNLAFFCEPDGTFRLAPAYDMLPMVFAPQGTNVVDRPFHPGAPTVDSLDFWPEALTAARQFWTSLVALADISAEFRVHAQKCLEVLGALAPKTAGTSG